MGGAFTMFMLHGGRAGHGQKGRAAKQRSRTDSQIGAIPHQRAPTPCYCCCRRRGHSSSRAAKFSTTCVTSLLLTRWIDLVVPHHPNMDHVVFRRLLLWRCPSPPPPPRSKYRRLAPHLLRGPRRRRLAVCMAAGCAPEDRQDNSNNPSSANHQAAASYYGMLSWLVRGGNAACGPRKVASLGLLAVGLVLVVQKQHEGGKTTQRTTANTSHFFRGGGCGRVWKVSRKY